LLSTDRQLINFSPFNKWKNLKKLGHLLTERATNWLKIIC